MSSTSSLIYTSSEQSALQWFELIFFAICVPFTTLAFLIHHRIPGGFLGWLFLMNFTIMRTVGNILIKAAHDEHTYIAGSIISGVSLAPLYFATIGIWHEVAHVRKASSPTLYGWRMQIIFHLLVGGGIAMVIAGAVQQTNANSTSSSARPLEIVGIIVLLTILAGFCFLLLKLWREALSRLEKQLLIAVTLVVPLLGLYTLYSLIGAAVDNDTWSFYRGPLAAEVIMQVLPTCLIVIIYAVAGFMTRGLSRERLEQHSRRQDLETMQTVPDQRFNIKAPGRG